jgi:hypothetical protein
LSETDDRKLLLLGFLELPNVGLDADPAIPDLAGDGLGDSLETVGLRGMHLSSNWRRFAGDMCIVTSFTGGVKTGSKVFCVVAYEVCKNASYPDVVSMRITNRVSALVALN